MTKTSLVVTLALLAVAAASLLVALVTGTFPISLLQLFDSLVFPAPGVVHDVIWQSRAPRAAACFVCGAVLALTGAWLQMLRGRTSAHRPGISGAVRAGVLAAVVAGASVALTHGAALSAVAAVLLATGVACVGLVSARALAAMGMVRRHRVLPPAGMLGGSLLTLADTFARL